jgi:hypothetical protein
MYPKIVRRKYPWGRVGMCLFAIYVVFLGILNYNQSVLENKSNPIRVESLVLNKGEHADSLTIYKLMPNWKYKKRIYETTYFESDKGLDIRIRSNNFPDGSRTMFCAYVGSFLSEDHIASPQELSYYDTTVVDRNIYSSVYRMTRPDSIYFAQAIGIFDKESYKAIVLIVRGDTVPLLTSKDIALLNKGIDFRLEDRIVKK